MFTAETIKYRSHQFILAFCAALALYAVIYAAVLRKKELAASKKLGIFAFVVYIVYLFTLTLAPGQGQGLTANLTPFSTIGYAFAEGGAKVKLIAALNVAVFMPLGIMLPMVFGIKGFFKVSALCFCATLTVELLQAALPVNRVFDVDDIILNAVGGMLGYGAQALARKIRWSKLSRAYNSGTH